VQPGRIWQRLLRTFRFGNKILEQDKVAYGQNEWNPNEWESQKDTNPSVGKSCLDADGKERDSKQEAAKRFKEEITTLRLVRTEKVREKT